MRQKKVDYKYFHYAKAVGDLVKAEIPELAGKMPWDDVRYLYLQGVSVEDTANRLISRCKALMSTPSPY